MCQQIDRIVGQKICEVRPMTSDEQEREMWYGSATVIVLENGVKLYPSQDDEGNGPGSLFGQDGNSEFVV